jgi:hypothetical protein
MKQQRKITSVAAIVAAATVAVAVPAAALADPPMQPSNHFITDTLGGNGKTQPDVGYRFITDTLAPGGGRVVVSVPAVTDFHWSDAGIGAGVAVAGAALAAAAARVAQRRRLAL